MVNQVELLFVGSGDNVANATIGFFSGRGFHDYHTDGNSIPNNATLTANTSPSQVIYYFQQKVLLQVITTQ